MKLGRKEFIRTALVFAGGGLGLTHLVGCGSDGPGPSGTGGSGGGSGSGGAGGGSGSNACAANAPATTIATNHAAGTEHTLTVTMADATAGVAKTYSIMGNSSHNHSVTISAANFTTLKAGTMITLMSTSGGGHTHGVEVDCA